MRKKSGSSVRGITETALASALIALSAMISIPFPVPFTLQIFGVYFALFYLGARRGIIAVLLYVMIGAVGLPVFSGFSGGAGRLFDATGGFIWGFILLSLVYLATDSFLPRGRYRPKLAVALSLGVFYLTGSLWYAAFYTDGSIAGYLSSLALTVMPFLLPDIVKIALAAIVASRINKIYKKSFEKQKKD